MRPSTRLAEANSVPGDAVRRQTRGAIRPQGGSRIGSRRAGIAPSHARPGQAVLPLSLPPARVPFLAKRPTGTRSTVLAGLLERADDGGRTRDLRLGKPTLYQLSYVRLAAGVQRPQRADSTV